jgi:hypothetical protein
MRSVVQSFELMFHITDIVSNNILKRESSIPPNEEINRHNICNVELQPNICDI